MNKREVLEEEVMFAVWRLRQFTHADSASVPACDGTLILYGTPDRCRQLLALHEAKE